MTFSNSCFSCLLWLATDGHLVIGQNVKTTAGCFSYGVVEGLVKVLPCFFIFVAFSVAMYSRVFRVCFFFFFFF